MHIFRWVAVISILRICSAQATQLPFEVASIRPNHSGEERTGIYFRAGGFVAENVSLKALIAYAYHVKDLQISGGSGWIESEKFNITAKEEDSVAATRQGLAWRQYTEQLQLMVQSLLAERFQLRISHQPKELPVLALVIAKGGPKFEKSSLNGYEADIRGRRGQLLTKGLSLAQLADILSWEPELGSRKVVDQTGVAGTFDITLRWRWERSPAAGGPPEVVQPDAPTLFDAVLEQLGLRLEPTKGPIDYLVIERAEKPSEN